MIPEIIAEACNNMNGMYTSALTMVDMAIGAKCDVIKFQLKYLNGYLNEYEHEKLKKYCDSNKIEYLCTPFSIEAVGFLESIYVKRYKIGSGDLLNFPLLNAVRETKKPILLSTGMSTLEEVDKAVEYLQGTNLTLIHSVSIYPCPYNRTNIDLIPFLRERYKLPIGLSDHTETIYTSIIATVLGAVLIEKHFTLDKSRIGPDHKMSLEPKQLKELVEACKAVDSCLGKEKQIWPEEMAKIHLKYHA
jgi:sialic acid synthase SpsE